MPIAGIEQPEFITVSGLEGVAPDGCQVCSTIRLHRYENIFMENAKPEALALRERALSWYQDVETVWLVDGVKEPYTLEKLEAMYTWLDRHGELYWIEMLKEDGWCAIGDVTFWQEDMPIVIGDRACRNLGIGRQVVKALVERGRKLGYRELFVAEIYEWNPRSQRMFESVGFRIYEKADGKKGYRLEVK